MAPGGTNAVGTLTLATSNDLSQATLLIDVAAGGVCDRIAVQGKLDLTGAALQIADTSKLAQGNRYVIATCEPGGLTGAFAADNLSTTPWTVSYNNVVGEVNLATRGLLLMVKERSEVERGRSATQQELARWELLFPSRRRKRERMALARCKAG